MRAPSAPAILMLAALLTSGVAKPARAQNQTPPNGPAGLPAPGLTESAAPQKPPPRLGHDTPALAEAREFIIKAVNAGGHS